MAQTPPLEWNNTLAFDNGKYSAGALWRVVAKQNRYSKGQGNIVGQDIDAAEVVEQAADIVEVGIVGVGQVED